MFGGGNLTLTVVGCLFCCVTRGYPIPILNAHIYENGIKHQNCLIKPPSGGTHIADAFHSPTPFAYMRRKGGKGST